MPITIAYFIQYMFVNYHALSTFLLTTTGIAVIQVMRRDGVQSVTVRVIAAEANASLAAVHYCFADKDDLLDAALDRWLNEMVAGSLVIDADGGLRACIMGIATAWWKSVEETPLDILAQFDVNVWSIRTGNRTHKGDIYTRYTMVLGDVFMHAMERAGEQSEMAPVEMARALLVIIDGCSLQYLTHPAAQTGHKELFFRFIELFDPACRSREQFCFRNPSLISRYRGALIQAKA